MIRATHSSICGLALAVAFVGLVHAPSVQAQQNVDLAVTSLIRQEAFNHSQVMRTLGELTEGIGPRLTNSPSMTRANTWARGKFTDWGLSNPHDESIGVFGRGWEFTHAEAALLAPRPLPLRVLPKAWTPGTNGPVEGDVVAVKLTSKEDLDKARGTLRGKIVLVDEKRAYKAGEAPDFKRHNEATLEEIAGVPVPADPTGSPEDRLKEFRKRSEFGKQFNEFVASEGVLATVSISNWDNGILRVAGGGSRKAGESVGVPAVVMSAEHYNTLLRAVARKAGPVRMRLNVDARFTDEDDKEGYNTIAEIPGTGPHRNEVVMLGAHMDSWHTGSGAADNGAGVAVVMEAVRILKAIGAKPDRTIRVALWSGEEQGLIGSAQYVADHFAAYPEPTDPAQKALPQMLRADKGKLVRKPAYEKLSAYFNLDNGSGRIRGVYAQENMAAVPLFESWLKPWNDVGAKTVTMRNTGSTDHISFDRVGLPGFQFIQDTLDYSTNVHHSDLDTFDHAVAEDLKQASAIMASFVYNAAMLPQKMPRKRLVEE